MAGLPPHIKRTLIFCDHRHVAVHKFLHRQGGNRLSRRNENDVYVLKFRKEIVDVYPVNPQVYHQIFARGTLHGVFMQIDGS